MNKNNSNNLISKKKSHFNFINSLNEVEYFLNNLTCICNSAKLVCLIQKLKNSNHFPH